MIIMIWTLYQKIKKGNKQMPTKYCEKHQIWYDYRETCPECFKFTKLAVDVVGSAIAATIGGVIVGGKKIHIL